MFSVRTKKMRLRWPSLIDPDGDGQRLLDLLGKDEPKYRYAG